MQSAAHMIQAREPQRAVRNRSSDERVENDRDGGLLFAMPTREWKDVSLVLILGCGAGIIYSTVSIERQRLTMGIITLTVHLIGGTIGRGRVALILEMAVAILLELLHTAGGGLVLAWDLGARLVADGRELDGAARLLLVARSGSSIR